MLALIQPRPPQADLCATAAWPCGQPAPLNENSTTEPANPEDPFDPIATLPSPASTMQVPSQPRSQTRHASASKILTTQIRFGECLTANCRVSRFGKITREPIPAQPSFQSESTHSHRQRCPGRASCSLKARFDFLPRRYSSARDLWSITHTDSTAEA